MITNKPAPDHLDKFLCHLQCFFFLKTNERKMEAASSQTQYPVFKRLQRHIGEPILTVLFWPKKVFQHDAFAFWFYIFKGNLVLLFVSQLKVLFSDAGQMTVKSFVLHLFPVSLTRKPYNKHLISLVFRSVEVNYGSSFFLSSYA